MLAYVRTGDVLIPYNGNYGIARTFGDENSEVHIEVDILKKCVVLGN